MGSNPNWTVPTAPAGTSDNSAASTEFVTTAITAASTSLSASKAGLTQSDFVSGIIKSPANQDYTIINYAPFPITLTFFSGQTASGTLTAALKINGSSVTGGSLSVSSARTTTTPSSANAATTADTVAITVSGISSPSDFSFTLKFTETLSP